MSQVLWCDPGNHAFSVTDEQKESYSSTRTVREGTFVSQVTATIDVCGDHKINLFQAPVQDALPAGS